jgi:hypothetical protein
VQVFWKKDGDTDTGGSDEPSRYRVVEEPPTRAQINDEEYMKNRWVVRYFSAQPRLTYTYDTSEYVFHLRIHTLGQ